MDALIRRRWIGSTAVALLAILSGTGSRVLGAQPRTAAESASCQRVVRDFPARAAAIRRNDDGIARLLDAKHYRQAASALRSAASRHPDAWAGYALGNLYAAGLGVSRNAGVAFRWYLWSAERGNRLAQRNVANAYLDGEGVERNATAAAYWFRIGIAPFQLARIYHGLAETYAGGQLAPVNRSKADYYRDEGLKELRELAKEPNGEAAYYLGLAYERGDGVSRDYAKAAAYLCRAASLQYAPAITAIHHLRDPSK